MDQDGIRTRRSSEQECGGVWVVSIIGQDGIRTRRSSEREIRLPMHARDDLSSARPRALTEPQKERGSNEARAPHPIHRGPSPWLIIDLFFAVSNSTVTDSSWCLHYLREPPLESWVRYLYSIYITYIKYTKVSFGVKCIPSV